MSVISITALETEVWPIFADARSLCSPLCFPETRTADAETEAAVEDGHSVAKKGNLEANEEERGGWKREVDGSERGNQLCGHYSVFPRWPSHRLRQLASTRDNGKGNNGEQRGSNCVRR